MHQTLEEKQLSMAGTIVGNHVQKLVEINTHVNGLDVAVNDYRVNIKDDVMKIILTNRNSIKAHIDAIDYESPIHVTQITGVLDTNITSLEASLAVFLSEVSNGRQFNQNGRPMTTRQPDL